MKIIIAGAGEVGFHLAKLLSLESQDITLIDNKKSNLIIPENQLDIKIKKEKEIYLGDIILNLSKVKNKNNKTKFKEELNKLWIHGLVHLFGHKHKKDKDFNIMNKIEKKYLEYIG